LNWGLSGYQRYVKILCMHSKLKIIYEFLIIEESGFLRKTKGVFVRVDSFIDSFP